MFRLYLAGGEIHVGKGVELGYHNVDVVRAYSVAQTHYGLAFICATYCMELARADLESARVEIFSHHIHSRGVTYENYTVGKLVGVQMEVENCPVGVDYEFGGFYDTFRHDMLV